MSRTMVDLDDEALSLASEELGTKSKVATVNAACHPTAATAELHGAGVLQVDSDYDMTPGSPTSRCGACSIPAAHDQFADGFRPDMLLVVPASASACIRFRQG